MQTVDVTAQVSGALMEVLFKEGDYRPGGTGPLPDRPAAAERRADQARATLTKDEAQAEAARKDDERYRRSRHGIRERVAGRSVSRDRASTAAQRCSPIAPRCAPPR